MIAARVLKKHRGRSSYGFLIRWTVWHRLRGGEEEALPEALLHMLGIRDAQLDKITAIYTGLERERGAFPAYQACMEIIQALGKAGKKPGAKPRKT